jgi:putative glycosyltransferase
MTKLSIVTTLYGSRRYIGEFYSRITATASTITSDFELIFVNDGSPDDGILLARELSQKDHRVRVIDLARNYGHHRAMMCGLHNTTGERIFLIDVDLEEVPEALTEFWACMESDPEIDVVVGQLEAKTVPFLKRLTSDAFYMAFNLLSPTKISNRDIVSRLMNRAYVDALCSYGESEIFFPAVWTDAGFHQHRITATKTYDGNTTYTLRKKISMAVDAITSYSNKPLIYIFYLGVLFSTIASFVILYLVGRKILGGQVFLGWTSLMAVQFLIGGIIIFSIGSVGIYISKIFIEVKGRPQVIVRRFYGKSSIDKGTRTSQ